MSLSVSSPVRPLGGGGGGAIGGGEGEEVVGAQMWANKWTKVKVKAKVKVKRVKTCRKGRAAAGTATESVDQGGGEDDAGERC